MVRTLKSRRNMRKGRRNTRRGGGIFNRLKRLFTRKSNVAPEPEIVVQPTVTQQPRPSTFTTFKKALFTPVQRFQERQQKSKSQALKQKSNTFFATKKTEQYDECVERVMWYLMQRKNGKTHAELLPYLNRPGSMKLTAQEFQDLKQLLLSMPLQELYSNVFGVDDSHKFDQEENYWERAVPGTSKEINEKCTGNPDSPGTCLLYAGTPYEKIAHANVGNSLGRFIVTNLLPSGRPINLSTNLNLGLHGCTFENSFTFSSNKMLYSLVQSEMSPYAVIAKTNFEKGIFQNFCLDNILRLRFVIDCFTKSFIPGSQTKVYFVTPQMGLWLQDTHPELFAAAFGTASGWGYEDKTSKPYTWNRISSLERIRMLTLQHWFARKVYSESEDESAGEDARTFFVSYPEPVLSLLFRLQENTDAEFRELAAEFEKNQRAVVSGTAGNTVITLERYIQFLQQRAQLTTRPSPRTPAFPPINLSQAVPYTTQNEADELFTNVLQQSQRRQPNLSTRAGRVAVLGRGRNRPGTGFGRMTYRHERR